MRELGAALGLVLLAGAGTAADLPAIQKRGSLRALVMFDEKRPEFFSKSGEKPGFDREVLEGFVALQKLKLEIVPVTSWDALIPALQQERGDLIAGRFTQTEARLQVVAFTHEVFPTRNVVLTRKPTRVVATLEELLKERIGTVRGSSMAEALAAAHVPAERIDFSLRPGLQGAALVDGRVSAVVMGVENAISEQRRDADMRLGLFLGPPGSLAWGLRKQDLELQRALDDYIASARRSTAWSRLVVKYFGENAVEVLKKARAQ